MTRKPDTPCAGCRKLLFSGSTSLPPGQRLCLDCRRAGRSPGQESAVRTEPVEEPPSAVIDDAGLGARGSRLWDDLTSDPSIKLSPSKRVLLEEVCRTADRLDKLDDFLTGRGDVWLRFRAANEDGSVVRVVVDRALSEVRQQQDTLRGLVADLEKDLASVQQPPKPEGSRRDELAKRRAERRGEAAGM